MSTPHDRTTPAPAGDAARPRIEWWLVLVVAALLGAVAIPGVRTQPAHPIDVPSVARLAELLKLARDEAVATGDDHFVLLQRPDGVPGVLLFRDIDGDARPAEVEILGEIALGPASWGRARAAERAVGDAGPGLAGPWSFDAPVAPAKIETEVDGNPRPSASPAPQATTRAKPAGAIRGVVFDPAGVPHRVSDRRLRGTPGSGAGSLYLRTTERDFAVVISPWGDVDVQRWDGEAARWQVAASL